MREQDEEFEYFDHLHQMHEIMVNSGNMTKLQELSVHLYNNHNVSKLDFNVYNT